MILVRVRNIAAVVRIIVVRKNVIERVNIRRQRHNRQPLKDKNVYVTKEIDLYYVRNPI